MEITPEIIGWIFTGVIGIFVIMGYFVGLIRGLNKSFYRFVWILAIGIVLIIVTPYVSRGLFDLDLSFLNLQINGQPLTSISNTVINSLTQNEQIAQMIEGNPDIVPMFLKMASLILNSILFVILFWILKILTLPFFWIFSKTKKKKKVKKVKSNKDDLSNLQQNNLSKQEGVSTFAMLEQPIKKRRALGSLMGIVIGSFIAIFTLLPFIGVINLVNDLNKIEIDNGSGGTTTLVQSYLPEEAIIYLDAYNASVGANLLKYTGLNFLANSTFKLLTSSTINNYTFSLVNEVETYAKLYSRIQKYISMDFTTITQEQLDVMVEDAEYVANELFSSGILSVVGSDLLPYFLLEISNNTEINISEIEEIDTALRQALKDISEVEITKYKEDLLNAVQIVKLINDEGILFKAINGEIVKVEQILDLVDEELFNEVLVLTLKFNTLKAILPIAFETGLDYLSKEFDFAVDYSQVVYNDSVINNFAKIFSSIYGVVLTVDLDKIETDIINAFSKQTIQKIGVVLDNIVNFDYIKGTTYKNATSKLKEYVAEILSEQEIYNIFKEYLIGVMDHIFNNDSWTNSFNKIADIYEIGIGVYEDYLESELNYNFVIDNISTIGKIVDLVDESNIIGSVKNAINVGIDCGVLELLTELINVGLTETEINNIADYLKACVNEVDNWEDELCNLVPLSDEIYEFVTEESTDDILTRFKNSNFLINMGRKLDTYFDNSKLINSSFFGSLISKIKPVIIAKIFSDSNNSSINSTIDFIASTLNSVVNWETELTAVKELLPIVINLLDEENKLNALKTENYLSLIGLKIDNAAEDYSKIFNSKFFSNIILKLEGFILEYLSEDINSTKINSVITLLSSNVGSVVSWQTELEIIKHFLEPVSDLMEEEDILLALKNEEYLKNIGIKIDLAKTNGSKIFTDNLFKNILIVALDYVEINFASSLPNEFDGVFQIIENNMGNVSNITWATEFNAIKLILNLDFETINVATGEGFSIFGQLLDDISASKFFNNEIIKDIICNVINSVIEDMESGMIKDAMQVVGETLSDETIIITSWETELTAISDLLQIDFSGFSLTNATKLVEIGETLDNINNPTETVLLSNENIKTILISVINSMIEDMESGMIKDAMQVVGETLSDETTIITSWETELTAISDLLQIDFSGFSLTNATKLVEIGETLDNIKSTKLLCVKNINKILSTIFTELIDNYIDTATNINIVTMFNEMLEGIDLLGNDSNLINYLTEYKDELSALKTLLDNLNDLIQITNVSNFDASTVGNMFDNLSTKKMVGTSGKHILFMLLDIVDLSEYPNLETLPTTMKTNAQSIINDNNYSTPYLLLFGEVKTFATHFETILAFDPEVSSISDLGIILEDIKTLNIAGESVADSIAIEMLVIVKNSIDETQGDPIQQQIRIQAKNEIDNVVSSIENKTNTKTYIELFQDLQELYNSL